MSPLREYQPPGTATSGASVSFAGYPPAMRPRAATWPNLKALRGEKGDDMNLWRLDWRGIES